MDQLIRETQPPAGTLRSPVPQYWNPDTEKYERVLGVHGAPRAMLYGPNGQPISTSNRLPVDVGAQVATESTLAEAVSRLNAILTRLEGTLDVDVGGQIHADVDLGDVTVQIGEVQQGKRGAAAEPWEVTLTGSLMQIVKEYKDVPYDQGDGLTGTYKTLHFGENMHAEGGYTRFLDVAAHPHVDVLLYNNTDVDLLAGVRIFPVPGIPERDYYGRYIFRNEVISNREVKKGDYLWIRSIEEPQLNRVAAISAHFKIKDNVPTEGTLSVIFLGSRI